MKTNYVERETKRNENDGWEVGPLMYAVASGRPVRFVLSRGRVIGNRFVVDQGTICAACAPSRQGIETLISITKDETIIRYVFLVAPEKVSPRSKRTCCAICQRFAFPELNNPKKEQHR